MKVTVSKKVHFDAAHHLPNYQGPCAKVHGHRWEVEIGVSGPVNPISGVVIDFKDLKRVIEEDLLSWTDHEDLNEYIENPTAEILSLDIWKTLKSHFSTMDINLEFIRIWESPDSCCEVRAE